MLNSERDVLDFDKRIMFNNTAEDEKYIWFWALNFNALFQVDKFTNTITRLSGFMTTTEQLGATYSKVVKYGNKIICIPVCSNNIAIYDLKSKDFHYIDVNLCRWNEYSQKRGKFWGCVCEQEYVYLLGFWDSYIYKFNMETEIIEKTINLYENQNKMGSKVYFKHGIIMKNKLLIPSCLDNIIFEINTVSMDFTIKRIEEMKHGFYAICQEGQNVWLTPIQDDPIIKWNTETDVIMKFDNYPKEIEESDKCFGFAVRNERFLWAFPVGRNKVIRVDLSNGNIESAQTINQYFYSVGGLEYKNQKYYMVSIDGNKISAYLGPQKELIVYDCEKDIISSANYQISQNDFFKFNIYMAELAGNPIAESDVSLEIYLKHLLESDQIETRLENNNDAGKEIHKLIKKFC